ncbi:hypothetical protein SNE510_19280 [Streptomyces sp. NE5-10]|nr:hypothetical protein SNE510_19280 [Streptomyces sp. NE5-10]
MLERVAWRSVTGSGGSARDGGRLMPSTCSACAPPDGTGRHDNLPAECRLVDQADHPGLMPEGGDRPCRWPARARRHPPQLRRDFVGAWTEVMDLDRSGLGRAPG